MHTHIQTADTALLNNIDNILNHLVLGLIKSEMFVIFSERCEFVSIACCIRYIVCLFVHLLLSFGECMTSDEEGLPV